MVFVVGILIVIVGGYGEEVFGLIFVGEVLGICFMVDEWGVFVFKFWFCFGKLVVGLLYVDEGVKIVLVDKGVSLFGVGVVCCEGCFELGVVVEFVGLDGVVFGKGIVGVGIDELVVCLCGFEVVYCDRLVFY